MTDAAVTTALSRTLVRDLRAFIAELALLPDDAWAWVVHPGVTNSVGVLTRHVCGNLRHFVGAVLGGDGYVRVREDEFGAPPVSREVLTAELERTIAAVERALAQLPAGALETEYPTLVNGHRFDTFAFLLHLSAHLGYHLGQANYARRLTTGTNAAGSAMSLAAVARP
jgi:hypothetical protein